MEDNRTWFFEIMQALEFSTYYMKNQNMMKEAECLYNKMVAMVVGAFVNHEITEHEFSIFDDYLSNVYNELFK